MKSLEAKTPGNNRVDQPLPPNSQSQLGCASCNERKALEYGANSDDGIVACPQCGAPLFYCDLGGQG